MFFGAGGEDVVAGFGKRGENLDYLLVRFSRTEDDLCEAASNLPMMIQAGKIEVLERQIAKFFDRLVNSKLVGLDVL